jgi:hypothetical protein
MRDHEPSHHDSYSFPSAPPPVETAIPSGLPTVIMLPEAGASAPTFPLSGPGVPGSADERPLLPPLSIRPPPAAVSLPSLHHGSDSSSHESSFGRSPHARYSPPRYSPYDAAWSQRGRFGGYASDTDPGLVLPPLRFEPSQRRGSMSAPPTGYGPPSARAPMSPVTPVSPTGSQYSDVSPPFAHFPPPFTLQPSPIWDHSIFTAAFSFTRRPGSQGSSVVSSHRSSAASERGRPSTSAGHEHSRPSFPSLFTHASRTREDDDREHDLSLAVRHARASHRYDPIRSEPEPSTSYPRRSTELALEHLSDDNDDDNEEEND